MEANHDNPYRAPDAELLAGENLVVGALYRMSAVGIATFFGTPLAGAFIIAHNLRAFGRGEQVRSAWGMGLGIFVAFMLVGYWLPEGAGGVGMTVAQVFTMHYYAKNLFGDAVAGHGGPFLSNWRAFGISLLFLVAVIVVLIPIGLLLV
ncbi:hypothetical protein [Pseudomonas sp. Gutcm_11s]|uniref:hypothetical protein n=1 Tax=Pseudomonas sp. Gutcm_11s TaxID=3026088 RepID=UPI00236083FA|nr:hypothetical protein [Pseudomonas sp. Gutcm_11s]MDD0844749.1 hypothetical protein [Pseudomonas sp. Gutcm_11s]